MTIGLVRGLHIIGVVLWFGALLQVTRMLKTRMRAPREAWPTLYDLERRTQLLIGLPGVILTLAMGVMLLVHADGAGAGWYMKQGWFHMKLTLVLVALGVDAALFVSIRRRKETAGGILGPLLMHIVGGLVLIATVLLVKLNVPG